MGLSDQYSSNLVVQEAVDDTTLTSPEAASIIISSGVQTSERAVRRLRENLGIINGRSRPQVVAPPVVEVQKGKIDIDPEGCTITNVQISERIDGDWSRVFEIFGLDPEEFEVVDDTVRMSTWQQSKALEDGTRDIVQLYSYSARFRRIIRNPEIQEKLLEVRKELLTPIFQPFIVPSGFDCPTTYKFDVADPQLGKKGTAEALDNWKTGVTRHLEAAWALGPTDLHVAFQGDEIENVFGHYANQAATCELNYSEQEQLDLEMRIWTIREALSLGLPVSVSSVISNHGERRNKTGGDPTTSRGDNASTKIARMAKMHFDMSNPDLPLTWHIAPDSTPFVLVEHSGVKAYYSHGYVEQGAGNGVEKKLIDAVEKQILGRPDELTDVKLVYVAHYHHMWSNDQRGRTFFGDPALEAVKSSEWVLDRFGQWSHPGILGMLVGKHADRFYSNLNIF